MQTRMTDYFSCEQGQEGAPEYRQSYFVDFPWIVNIVVLPEWFTKYEDLLYHNNFRCGLKLTELQKKNNDVCVAGKHR